mgnify:CR=1 FL=1
MVVVVVVVVGLSERESAMVFLLAIGKSDGME